MNISQHIPEGIHRQYIDALVYFDSFMPDHSIERVVPTGNIFLLIELDGIERYTYEPETLQPNASFTRAWISGMHKDYLSISAPQNSSMFVVQFKPYGAYPYLKVPMHEVAEKVVSAELLFGDAILELRAKLINTTTADERFQIAEDWLSEQLEEQRAPSEELLKVVHELQQEPVANLNEIIERFPNTQKHLIDLFKRHMGLTPKSYQRILRFNEILQRVQHQEQISWTDIAYSCGYSDQSHFIKEFRYFSGFNPKDFISEEHNKQPNFFPLDRQG